MNKTLDNYTSVAPLQASRVEAYRCALDVLVMRLRSGTAEQILSAFRAALVAEALALRDTGGMFEQLIVESIHEDIAQVDRDLADLELMGRGAN